MLFSTAAYACVCGESEPPVEFNSAEAVFIGKMLGGTEKLTVTDDDSKERTIEAGTVRFHVVENFKGAAISQIVVQIASHAGTTCGPYGLTPGKIYLIYAYAGEGGNALLYTGVCTRTSPINSEWIKRDLEFLRNLPPVGSGGNIDGKVWFDHRFEGRSPFAGIKVRITKPDGKVMTIRTDNAAEFHLKKLPPGVYRVEPQLPTHYVLDEMGIDPAIGYNVEVDDRGTVIANFKVLIDSRVSGRLLDRDGRGINTAMLQLIRKNRPADSLAVDYAHSDGENGDFTADDVAAGEYYLYLELENRDFRKNRKYFYPGTYEQSEATLIKLDLGGTVSGLVFTLPDEFRVRTVQGRVLLPDGKPAASVDVGLWSARSADPNGFVFTRNTIRTTTDNQGRFHLEGLTNEVYCLSAATTEDDSTPDSVHRSSPRKTLLLTEDVPDQVLTLSETGVYHVCLGDP